MFVQSQNEIAYQEDRWVNLLLTAMMVAIMAGGSFLLLTLPNVERLVATIPLPHALLIWGPSTIVAVLTLFILAKTLGRAQMVITSQGLRYTDSGVSRYYPWDRLNSPVFVDCGRGAGYYRIDVVGERKPIEVNLTPFGISRREFENVIATASRGTLPDVAALRQQPTSRDFKVQSTTSIMPTLIAVVVMVAVFLIMRR